MVTENFQNTNVARVIFLFDSALLHPNKDVLPLICLPPLLKWGVSKRRNPLISGSARHLLGVGWACPGTQKLRSKGNKRYKWKQRSGHFSVLYRHLQQICFLNYSVKLHMTSPGLILFLEFVPFDPTTLSPTPHPSPLTLHLWQPPVCSLNHIFENCWESRS